MGYVEDFEQITANRREEDINRLITRMVKDGQSYEDLYLALSEIRSKYPSLLSKIPMTTKAKTEAPTIKTRLKTLVEAEKRVINRSILHSLAKKAGIGESTADTYLHTLISEGAIKRVGRGLYVASVHLED